MKKVLLWIAGIIVGTCFCYQTTFAAKNIPTINIRLNDVSLETITSGSKETKYPGNHVSIVDDGQTIFFDDVEVKGRGNTTWAMPKKPFQIKFDKKTDLFNLGASKKWVLLADYLDDAHLRNSLAFHFVQLLDMEYANRGQFVNLYIDGAYQGLYLLCHKTELGSNTVDLEDELGVLFEMDNIHEPDEDYFETSYGKHRLLIKDSVSDDDEDLTQAGFEDFRAAYGRFEKALYAGDWDAIVQEIDLESFAKYFLIYEYSVNPDGVATSFYFYKDGPEDKIHAGPAWDYDYAFANCRWRGTEQPQYRPYRSWGKTPIHFHDQFVSWDAEIYYRLLDFADFRDLVKQIFQTKIAPNLSEINDFIVETADYIRPSAFRDNLMWGRDDFDVSSARLRRWSRERLSYMNILYGINNTIVSGSYFLQSSDSGLNQTIFDSEFYLQPQKDGSYKIIDINTGKALSAIDPREPGTEVRFMKSAPNDSQRWYITHNENGQNYIFTKANGLMLTIDEGRLTLQELHYNDSQTFDFIYHMRNPIKANGRNYYQIISAANPQLTYNGTDFVASTSLDAPFYQIVKKTDGSYLFVNPATGQSSNWIIVETTAGNYKLIQPQQLEALTIDRGHAATQEISGNLSQEFQLVEVRSPQLSNPNFIARPQAW